MNEYVNGHMLTRPRRSAVSVISRAWALFMPSGFSHRTWSPRSSAAIVYGWWWMLGATTITASRSSRSSISSNVS